MAKASPTRRTTSGTRAAAQSPVPRRAARAAHTDLEHPLLPLLAGGATLATILPALHAHVLAVTGGRASLILEPDARSGAMHATSASAGFDGWGEVYVPAPHEQALVESAFRKARPALIVEARDAMPDLAARMGDLDAHLLVPLLRGDQRLGLLVVGYRRRPAANSVGTRQLADTVVTALDLGHLREKERRHRELRTLLDAFAARLTSLNLVGALQPFAVELAQVLGGERVTVWLADRRARDLVLQASSDLTASGDAPKALLALALSALRQTRADVSPSSGGRCTITIPLRGTRRALGVVVIEGVPADTERDLERLDRVDEVGHHLSPAIENMLLLDNVLRSRRELENTFDSITDLVVVCNRRGQITQVNQAFANRLGLTRDQLLDRPIDDTVGAELATWLREHATGAARSGPDPVTTMEVHDPVLNGRFLVTLSDLLNSERMPVGTVIVGRDLAGQLRLEAEREELRKRLGQSEKLAALGEFVAGIAHELNNPLQGVLGHLELMRATGAFPRQLRREVQTIYREADRAAKIVRNLLVFAGSRRLVRRSVSANIILQKVVALRAGACRAADIELVRHYDEGLPRVQSDPLLLHQAFLNIVMNAEQAIAATGRPGRIEVATGLSASGDRVRVMVRDTGHGIPAEVLSRLFEPFYTTKEVGKGTGLGLAIAYGIIQEHGGQIAASNHPDGGAVFTVELPVKPVV